MSVFRVISGLASAIVFSAGASVANAGVFYECDLNTRIVNGWVSPKMGFVFDDNGQVTVIDGVILSVVGAPLKASVRRKGNMNRIRWSIAGATDSRGQRIATFRYVADLNRATGAVHVVAKPGLAAQRWAAKGTCKTRVPEK